MAKDPRAKVSVKTFTYPSPLDEPIPNENGPGQDRDHMIDPEVAEDKENLPWVKIRIPRSKKDIDLVAEFTASILTNDSSGGGEMGFKQRIASGNRQVFELLCEGWSFEQQYGLKPDVTSFGELDIWAGDWITNCVGDALRLGTTRDYAKKIPNSSPSPEPLPNASSSDPSPESVSQ